MSLTVSSSQQSSINPNANKGHTDEEVSECEVGNEDAGLTMSELLVDDDGGNDNGIANNCEQCNQHGNDRLHNTSHTDGHVPPKTTQL